MAGKVFISCGQRPPYERKIALQVKEILEKEFCLKCYLAFKIQSLADIMTITKELRSSDYYLFIDFLRRAERPEDLEISLFTHQELALAHNLQFQDMIALQENGAKMEGFIRYVLGNPEPFSDESDLYDKIRILVRDKGWSKDFSRNLVVTPVGFTIPFQYNDHTGSHVVRVWQARVENRRPDVAAIGTVCILDYIIRQSDGKHIDSPDRAYLKWAGQGGYERTILPKDFGDIDLLSIHADMQGVFLHSLRDASRDPIVEPNGMYSFFFKLFSSGFPLVEFAVALDLQWKPLTPTSWPLASTASLL